MLVYPIVSFYSVLIADMASTVDLIRVFFYSGFLYGCKYFIMDVKSVILLQFSEFFLLSVRIGTVVPNFQHCDMLLWHIMISRSFSNSSEFHFAVLQAFVNNFCLLIETKHFSESHRLYNIYHTKRIPFMQFLKNC